MVVINKRQKELEERKLDNQLKVNQYREDDSEEGSQLQSATLEEAMGNKKEE